MSEQAYRLYETALREQHLRTVARRIRTRVNQARRSTHSAGIRWPFELLQNALDAGPREGRANVTVRLRSEPTRIFFEHDGAPFTWQELAALLSGGSSKELESDITTGRFGTGFLVTHVLSERTRLRGLLQLETDYEHFDVTLNRGGDEDAILGDIRQSNQAIRAAEPVPDPAQVWSAVFEYERSDSEAWGLGLKELKRALPYLYGTRKRLGRLEFNTDEGEGEIWDPSVVVQKVIDGGYLEYRAITVSRDTSPTRKLTVYRFTALGDRSAVALVVVEETPQGSRVCLPDPDMPRVYREYPLRSSGFIPVNLILDGKFDPDEERSGLLMSINDRALIEQALSAAVIAVRYAVAAKWKGAHWLARASRPATGFDSTDIEEKDWWTEQLAAFASQLAVLPIVECKSRYLPAISDDGDYADFIAPQLLPGRRDDETSVDRLWPLVEAASVLFPPRRELAPDWTQIAEGWCSLHLPIEPICVATLAERVREDATILGQLKVEGNARAWLATFLDIVGECWGKRNGTDLTPLDGLMPNQNLQLRSPSALKRDQGVSEELKDICTGMGYDIRDELFLNGFAEIANSLKLDHLTKTLEMAISIGITEDEIISDAVKYMGNKLPEDRDCADVATEVQLATVQLLAHLWESRREAAAAVARQVPLIASSRRAVRWSSERQFMGPVPAWPDSAQPFADAYPPSRVLDDLYVGSEAEEIPNVASALAEWGMAVSDPIIDVTIDLKDRRLAALNGGNTTGVVVPGEQLSQIALLQPEVLNRCQEGVEQARSLLGLVLCDVARRDPAWKEQRIAQGRRATEGVAVPIRGALWLADLKVRAWVPQPGEDGKPQKVVANAATLQDILDPLWLQDNDDAIQLLSEWFGFDRLELRLMGIAQNERKRQELRDSLAGLVETGGADPEFYTALVAEAEARQQRRRDVERCKNLGIAVQEAIGAALERHKLKVRLVDKGFDYEVAGMANDVIEDAGTVVEIGPYLVEVKATRTGHARLTPMQAETASRTPERYVLCVVNLGEMSDDSIELPWTADRVEPLAKLVPNIGGSVEETYRRVDGARTLDVGIRNESALRYEVPSKMWESGVSIMAWVQSIKTTLSR